jgi:hypothetical protein
MTDNNSPTFTTERSKFREYQKPRHNKIHNRNHRYTFPNELDNICDTPKRHKRRRKTHDHTLRDKIIITEYDNYKKCKQIHPYEPSQYQEQEQDQEQYHIIIRRSSDDRMKLQNSSENKNLETTNNTVPKYKINAKYIVGCISSIAIKLLCVLGILTVT